MIKITISIIAFASLSIGSLLWCIIEDAKEQKLTNEKLRIEKSLNSNCASKRDSLLKEIAQLSTYKTLTRAMSHRDEATSLLKYKVGDFTRLKRDSSKVLISDIIIGGSKHEYYVKYKVTNRDNITEEILPELLY